MKVSNRTSQTQNFLYQTNDGATRRTATARNRLVLSLATETVAPFVAAGSPLAALIEAHRHE